MPKSLSLKDMLAMRAAGLLSIVMLLAMISTAAQAQEVDQIRQFGTAGWDRAWAVASDPSGVYVVGETRGTFPQQKNAGLTDAFVRKYSTEGGVLWNPQFGTAGNDTSTAVAVDSTGVYVAGEFSEPPYDANDEYSDGFVRKYDLDGTLVWSQQLSAMESYSYDRITGIAASSAGLYVVGTTSGILQNSGAESPGQEAYVRHLDAGTGQTRWTRQFGSDATLETATGVAADATGAYVVGEDAGAFYLRRYDSLGKLLQTVEGGPAHPASRTSVAVDATGVYVAGSVSGNLQSPTEPYDEYGDAFVRKYDASGKVLWTDQFGQDYMFDGVNGIAADATGVYIVGETNDGQFAGAYAAGGARLWTRPFYSTQQDQIWGVAVGAAGVHIAGGTNGTLIGQTSVGGFDAFVGKVSPIATDLVSLTLNEGQVASNTGRYSNDQASNISISASSGNIAKTGTNSGTWSWSLGPTDGPVDSQVVTVTAADGTGGVWTTSFPVKITGIAPSATLSAPAVVTPGGALTLSLTGASDPSTADTAAGFKHAFDCGDGTGYGPVDATNTTTCTAIASGRQTVKGKVVDKDGQFREYSKVVMIDTGDAPSGSLRVNNGDAYTKSATATLAISATDPDPGTGVSTMRFSNNGTAWTAWQGYATSKSWSLTNSTYGGTTADGTKTVYAQFRDGAGNVSTVVKDTIGLDTTAPGGSVKINGGAAYTRTTAATLTLSATDPASGSGVTAMRFSNNGTTWSTWAAYATSKAWTLTSGNGTKRVYVQFRDALGHVSTSRTDTIVLDATAPTVSRPNRNLAQSTVLKSPVPVDISWDGTDVGGSGLQSYRVQRSTNGGAYSDVTLPVPDTFSVTLALTPSTYYQFRVQARDNAGNVGGWSYGPRFQVLISQETSTAITYTGTWSRQYVGTVASGNYVKHSSIAGARATFTFTGAPFAWVAAKGPNRGKAEIWINGYKYATVDLYSATTTGKVLVPLGGGASWNPTGTYRYEVRVLGTKNAASSGKRVDIDAFVVIR